MRSNRTHPSAKRVAERYFRNQVIRPMVRRADAGMDPDEAEALIDPKDATKEGYKILSPKLYQELRHAFGSKVVKFFSLYRTLRGIQLGRPVPKNLVSSFQKLAREMANARGRDRKKISPPVKDRLFKSAKKIVPKLQVVVRAYQSDPTKRGATQTWRPIIENYSTLIEMLARDKGVYLKVGRYVGVGGAKWPVFFKMNPKEEEMERLADEDPSAFESVQRLKKTRAQLDARAAADIRRDGLNPEKTQVSGKWVNIGVDDVTKIALDELKGRQRKMSNLLKRPNRSWAAWFRKAQSYDQDSEEYREFLKDNAEPEFMPRDKLEAMHKRWERTEPPKEDVEEHREWEANEPTIEGLRDELFRISASYQKLKEEYELKAEEIVYEYDGTRMTVAEYKEKQKQLKEEMKALASDNLIGDELLDSMRLFTEESMDRMNLPVSSISLTDDKSKQHRLTRMFDVKEVPIQAINRKLPKEERLYTGKVPYEEVDDLGNVTIKWKRRQTVQVVTSGRYAGIPVDHLVNENGRLIERTEFIFDRKSGKRGRPKRDPTGYDQAEREPFVSVAEDGRLFISVSNDPKWRGVVDGLHEIGGLYKPFQGRIDVKGVSEPGATVTIGSEVLTAVEGPRTPGQNDFSIDSGDPQGIATDLLDAIKDGDNTLITMVKASRRGANITITARHTLEDKALTLAVSDAANYSTTVSALKEGQRKPDKELRLANPPGFEKDGSYYHGAKNEKGELTRKTGQYGFFFTPENFGLLKEKIGSFALSEGAAKQLEDYFDGLTRAEKATADENLAPFAHHNLGGFKDWVLNEQGEEWDREKRKYENLQRQHSDDPRVGKWARKAQELRDKLNRPHQLLKQKRKLEEALKDRPKDPRAREWAAQLEQLNETFRNEELGGFEFGLLELQKKALAWMESRGDNGVCSLDTGIGKTLTSLAMIQKLIRDGWTEDDMVFTAEEAAAVNEEYEQLKAIRNPDPATRDRIRELEDSPAIEYPSGTNGRFLYVAPSKNLLGNLDKEAADFLTEEGYSISGSKIDAIVAKGRGSFQAAMNKAPGEDYIVKVQRGGGTGEVEIENFQEEATRYVAVFFDEAHEYMTKSTGAPGKAFLGFKHPRKVVLTASPMTNEPMDAYLLASVCNNNDLSDTGTPEGRQRRADMREWKERYCETVGGRVVGAKQGDPTVERDLKTWARTNLFFADKQSVTEDWARPPKLERDSNRPGGGTRVAMNEEVESASKGIAKQIEGQMKNLYLRFRDRGYLRETKMVFDPEKGREVEMVVPTTRYKGKESKKGVHDPDLEKYTKLHVKPFFELLTMLSLAPELAVIPKIDKRVDEKARKEMEKLFARLFPGKKAGDRVFPDLTMDDNPKFQEANRIVGEKLANDPDTGTGRVLLWSDNAKVCLATAQELSKKQPGSLHAAALANKIVLFKNGAAEPTYTYPGGDGEDAWPLPFKKGIYKLYKGKKPHKKNNPGLKRGGKPKHTVEPGDTLQEIARLYRVNVPNLMLWNKIEDENEVLRPGKKIIVSNKAVKGEQFKWAQFVTKNFIQGDPDVRTMTCFGPAYQSGQNFQGFQTVIHLDRDHWNNENMKQRTARAYRQGQKNVVEEVTLDATYSGKPKAGDASLDELRRMQQAMEGDIFDGIVKASQDHPLGTEWTDIQQKVARYTHTDLKALEMMLAPGSMTR
jgi:LysM repeat protein